MDKTTFVLMTGTLAYQIFIGAVLISSEIFAVAEQHRQSMLALPDPTGYDFSTGWPEEFSDHHSTEG